MLGEHSPPISFYPKKFLSSREGPDPELEPLEKLVLWPQWLHLICDVNCIDLHNVLAEVLFYLHIKII